MSSILTNNGAMVALQTLKTINSNLTQTQNEISTGKRVSTAKDNSAVWAISKVMESDVKGFKGISDSLSLGQSTVSVARQAAETVTDLLTQMKGKIVSAQEANVDRTKIQSDVTALSEQIAAVVSGAQLNGLNLLKDAGNDPTQSTVKILSSLDRSSTGVAATSISVAKQDLGTNASSITGTAVATANNNMTGAIDATTATLSGNATTAPTTSLTIAGVSAGFGYSLAISGGAGNFVTGVNTTSANDISYVARDGDTVNDVAAGLVAAFNAHVTKTMGANVSTVAATATNGVITITGSSIANDNFAVTANGYAAAGNTAAGGLNKLSSISVTSDAGVASALTDIESLIQTSIAAASSFGSAQGRIDTQSSFVNGLISSLKAGIGSLVDTNMEEASARLQALQVQQQLGVQALSIANQAPQSILSLFR